MSERYVPLVGDVLIWMGGRRWKITSIEGICIYVVDCQQEKDTGLIYTHDIGSNAEPDIFYNAARRACD